MRIDQELNIGFRYEELIFLDRLEIWVEICEREEIVEVMVSSKTCNFERNTSSLDAKARLSFGGIHRAGLFIRKITFAFEYSHSNSK